jgi:2-methylcitrate dehydratase
MKKDYQTQQIARFSLGTKFDDIGDDNIDQLKRHLLDAMGSLIHATSRPAIQKLINQYRIMGDGGKCRVPLVKNLPYDRAGQLFTALIRYPDFMDNFMGKEATCHPSDNIGALLAISQYKAVSGKDFLTAMAVGYQVECRLIQEIPVMKKGIDHTVLLAYSVVAAMARLIGLHEEQAAHALGMAGCSINSMVTSRASYTYEWKGFASSLDALDCINLALLAEQGMTGPISIFEGPKGVKDVFDMELDYDWSKETFELIQKCVLKKYNAEVHSQSVLEAALFLKEKYGFTAADIEKIDITTFLTAFHIIGSGAYGDRKTVASKEQADHSLFYVTAVALLDGEVYPAQFEPERINRADVQQLLQKISVHTSFPLHKPVIVAGILDPYTQAYPDKMKAKVSITLKKGETLVHETEDYPGFFTKPFTWEDTINKFKRLSSGIIPETTQDDIINIISDLDQEASMMGLIKLISSVGENENEPAKIPA